MKPRMVRDKHMWRGLSGCGVSRNTLVAQQFLQGLG